MLRAGEPQFVIGDAAQAVGDRRLAGGELAGVADDDHVAGQLFLVARDERIEILAADFFFAFDQELELHRQPAGGLQPRLGPFDVREHLALVVGGAAGVDIAVAAGRLERRRKPFGQRIGRLHVVMAVDQQRPACRAPAATRHRRSDCRPLEFFPLSSRAIETAPAPNRRPDRHRRAARVGADAGNAEQFAQIVFEARGVLIEIGVEVRHGG